MRPLEPDDRAPWDTLWAGYLRFYETELAPAVTEATWARLIDPEETTVNGLIAERGGAVVGIAHYILHPVTWFDGMSCYLEDLFVADEARGTGAGRALLDHLAGLAGKEGWRHVYWQTAEANTVARRLYDRAANRTTWVRYEMAAKHE